MNRKISNQYLHLIYQKPAFQLAGKRNQHQHALANLIENNQQTYNYVVKNQLIDRYENE